MILEFSIVWVTIIAPKGEVDDTLRDFFYLTPSDLFLTNLDSRGAIYVPAY